MTNKTEAETERADYAGHTPSSFWNGEMPDDEREKWIDAANIQRGDHLK